MSEVQNSSPDRKNSTLTQSKTLRKVRSTFRNRSAPKSITYEAICTDTKEFIEVLADVVRELAGVEISRDVDDQGREIWITEPISEAKAYKDFPNLPWGEEEM